MKVFLFTFVVLLHLVAIILLLNMTAIAPEQSEQLNGKAEDIQKQSPAFPSPAAPSSVEHPARKFDALFFRERLETLPPELAQKAKACKTGILVDWDTHEIFWQKNEEKAVPIASLTKMMTSLLLMETLETSSDLTLDKIIKVTPEAYEVGGSQVYLDPRESFTLRELLKCITIFSANDAAYLVAQFLGKGNVDEFVQNMNERSRGMGLDSLQFFNPHGLPVPGSDENRGNALQLAFLAGQLLEYPEILKWSSTWLAYIREDSDKPFQLVNRNRLVQSCPGVNGMKTGFTQQAGFCLAATCEREGRRMIAAVTGFPTAAARNDFVAELLDWAYQL